jgi:hypothetical protein
MKSLKNMSKAGWLVAGILVAAVVAPSAAIATSAGLTQLEGSGGQRAAVTNDGQLTTTEAAPSSYEDRFSSADAPGTNACENLPVFSKSAGFVVKEVAIDADDVATPAASTFIAVFLGPNCSLKTGVVQVNPSAYGMTDLPFTTGLVIPKGGTISFEVGHAGAIVTAFGYTVPPKDAPHYSGTNPAGHRGVNLGR